MEFRIADSFTAALGKLTRDEQKAVKTSEFDLQTNPEHPGLQWPGDLIPGRSTGAMNRSW